MCNVILMSIMILYSGDAKRAGGERRNPGALQIEM